ncbi:MAG: DUF455 family protein [SAR324 cluster bacterium]|nr:DUF455 family protein [SAR324 cluster bacterium]
MKIQEFAERILLGKTLSEKLLHPGHIEDPGDSYQTTAIPPFPNRPPGLSLENWHRSKRVRFPNAGSLDNEKQRGIVLHFFANHELLALELIALALLRFPEAPKDFRWGLVNILREEQSHMTLYEKRMRSCGVELGEIPVNDFFWKCLSRMQSPQEFVSGMSLTLEQANLDYALHYAAIFHQIGDQETARILKKVYQDEIGHVRHGLVWFKRWKSSKKNDWEAYKESLVFPLSPARAKGIGFDEEGRRQAGFSEHYISEIALYSQSKGRTPRVFYFNPACESEIAFGNPNYTPSKPVAQMTKDFTAIPMFFAQQDDVILVSQKPSASFLSKIRDAGFSLPEFVEFNPSARTNPLENLEIAKRKVNSLHPWGWSPKTAQMLQSLHKNTGTNSTTQWHPQFLPLFSKAESAKILNELFHSEAFDPHWGIESKVVGRVCHTSKEVEEQVACLKAQGFEHLAVKASFGASGQNIVHLHGSHWGAHSKNRIDKILNKQNSVVVEPWLEKVLDLSCHFDLHEDGKFTMRGTSRFFTDARGQYRGSVVGRFDAGLGNDLLKFLHKQPFRNQPKPLPQMFRQIATRVAARFSEARYAGPVGIDSLVYQVPGEALFRFKPIVEINPRFSMGRLALELAKILQHRHLGIWLVLSMREIQASGFANIPEFAETLEKKFPLETINCPGKKICRGILFTTDPNQANNFVSFLRVGESLEECLDGMDQFLDAKHPLMC